MAATEVYTQVLHAISGQTLPAGRHQLRLIPCFCTRCRPWSRGSFRSVTGTKSFNLTPSSNLPSRCPGKSSPSCRTPTLRPMEQLLDRALEEISGFMDLGMAGEAARILGRAAL